MNTSDLAIPLSGGFFHSYLIDHHIYKQEGLLYLLDHYDQIQGNLKEQVPDIDDEQFRRTLRVEARATYYQAVETLFELIFALEPRNKVIDNRNLWYFLSTSDWRSNFERIEEIAKGDLAFLDRPVVANKGITVPFIQYVFFFGVTKESMPKAVQDSFEPIRKFLRAFAGEFSDRDEYNAIKHSVRLVHLLKDFQVGPHGSDKRVKRDLEDSMSYIKREDDLSLSIYTKPLDTIRDFKMTQVCSRLTSNIFRCRKYHFTKDDSISIHTITDETFTDATKRNLDWEFFKMNITPLPDSDQNAPK